MDRLYKEVSDTLVENYTKYLDGEISLETLRESQRNEEITRNYGKIKQIKKNLKTKISENLRRIYNKIQEINRKIKTLEKMESGEEKVVDLGRVFSHGRILGRNKMPPPGFHNSNWYVGPYPNIQMLNQLGNKSKE